jgi:hypothetical protein
MNTGNHTHAVLERCKGVLECWTQTHREPQGSHREKQGATQNHTEPQGATGSHREPEHMQPQPRSLGTLQGCLGMLNAVAQGATWEPQGATGGHTDKTQNRREPQGSINEHRHSQPRLPGTLQGRLGMPYADAQGATGSHREPQGATWSHTDKTQIHREPQGAIGSHRGAQMNTGNHSHALLKRCKGVLDCWTQTHREPH